MLRISASYLEFAPTADSAVLDEGCYFHGALIKAAAAASEIIVYDGAVAASKEVGRVAVAANGFDSLILNAPVRVSSLRVVVTGAGAIGGVYYGR